MEMYNKPQGERSNSFPDPYPQLTHHNHHHHHHHDAYYIGDMAGRFEASSSTLATTMDGGKNGSGFKMEVMNGRAGSRQEGTRTPSPTPSELKELKSGAIDWKTLGSWKFWLRREWLWYYVGFIIILVVTVLVSLYHKQIVRWLTPGTQWIHDLKFGWLVPIAVLFVISFPPLFGHEIVAILCGLVWGLWLGFGIVAAGTFLGEVGNYYAFKYCCRSRGEKLEKSSISYGCLAKVVRDGGFKIALIARLSAIPGHFTTAVFSTCGMGIFVFSIAAILSMPKQVITVYLGVILEQSESGTAGPPDKQSRIISNVVLGITLLITIAAMWYIVHRMNQVKPEVIYLRRKARQLKLARARDFPYSSEIDSSSQVTVVYNPNASDMSLPLDKQHTQAIEYTGDSTPRVYAPQARQPPPIDRNPFSDRVVEEKHPSAHPRTRQNSTEEVGWELNGRRADFSYAQPSGNPYPGGQAQRMYAATALPQETVDGGRPIGIGRAESQGRPLYDSFSSGQEREPADTSYRTAVSRSHPLSQDERQNPFSNAHARQHHPQQ